jgi:hypothetical protein
MAALATKSLSVRQLSASALNRPYFVFSASADASDRQRAPAELHLNNGVLTVNGRIIRSPEFSNRSVSWRQQDSGFYSAGHLTVSRNGVDCWGTLVTGSTASVAVTESVIATAVPTSRYATQVSKIAYKSGTDPTSFPESAWEPGPELDLAFSYSAGEVMPAPKVQFGGSDISGSVALRIARVNDEDRLNLQFDLDDGFTSMDRGWISGSLLLSVWGDIFGGELSKAGDTSGGVYLWRGKSVSDLARASSPKLAAATAQASAATAAKAELSPAELFGLLPDDSVLQATNKLLLENAKNLYALSDEPVIARVREEPRHRANHVACVPVRPLAQGERNVRLRNRGSRSSGRSGRLGRKAAGDDHKEAGGTRCASQPNSPD